MLWGFILMFVGVAIGVVGKKLMHEELVTVVGILVSLLGMFLTVYPYLAPARPRKSQSNQLGAQAPSPAVVAAPPKDLPYERPAEYLPSITEGTTNLLPEPAATGTRKKDRTTDWSTTTNVILPGKGSQRTQTQRYPAKDRKPT